MKRNDSNPTPVRIWGKALLKVIAGLGAICLYWPLGLMDRLKAVTAGPGPVLDNLPACLLLLVLSIPFVVLCMGIIELATGRPFSATARSWNAMREGRQGVASFLLLSVMIGATALILWLAVLLLTR